MTLPSDVIRDLEELFQTAQRGPKQAHPLKGPVTVVHLGPNEDLVFHGRTKFLLDDLARRLARSALEHGGPSPEAVTSLLIQATGKVGQQTSADLIAGIAEELDKPEREWEFAEEIFLDLREGSVPVGACQVFAQVPERFMSDPNDAKTLFRGGSAITTVVQAHDEVSALQIADERFEEARAILAQNTYGELRQERSFAMSRPTKSTHHRGGPFFRVPDTDLDGKLVYEFGYMSEAATRLGRKDWERRVLAAARWSMRARLSRWPAQKLAASMIALETIFVRDKKAGIKKDLISHGSVRIARAVLYDKSPEEQEDWISELYDRRNEVAHEGQNFLRDLEIDHLLDVVWMSVGWAARHLWPWHRAEGKPCLTFDEAMAPHT